MASSATYTLGVTDPPLTVSRRLATIKHFGRILAEEISGFQNPARRVKSPKIEVAQPKALAAKDLTACLDTAHIQTIGGILLDDHSFQN